jgi:POT family proton-dependent oligopeptide transporter
MGINLGAFLGPLATGFLAQSEAWKRWIASFGFDPASSWHWGFGAAGVGMVLGILWLRSTEHRIAHVGNPPAAGSPRPWRALAAVAAGSTAFIAYVSAADRPGWEWLRSVFVVAPVVGAIALGLRREITARRMAVVLVFFLAAMLFWGVFEQGGSTLALFGNDLTRRTVLGWEFPSAWYQAIGSVFVVLLAPLAAWMWARLGSRQPSSPFKLALGLAFLAASFALMVPAARLTASGLVSPWWLVGVFFLQTLGELCLSPVGLSAMTRLAPERWVGVVMGVWFLADALGNKLAGILAGGFTAADPVRLASFFETQALGVACGALALFSLVPALKRLMVGVL